eukprot:5124737-Amphidinium_carterae.1
MMTPAANRGRFARGQDEKPKFLNARRRVCRSTLRSAIPKHGGTLSLRTLSGRSFWTWQTLFILGVSSSQTVCMRRKGTRLAF